MILHTWQTPSLSRCVALMGSCAFPFLPFSVWSCSVLGSCSREWAKQTWFQPWGVTVWGETHSYSFIHSRSGWAAALSQAHARCWGSRHLGGGSWRNTPTNEHEIINCILCSKGKQWGLWEDNCGALIWGLGWGGVREFPCVKYLSFEISLPCHGHADACEVPLKLHECLRVCTPMAQGLPRASSTSEPAPRSTLHHTHADSYPQGLHFSVLNFV